VWHAFEVTCGGRVRRWPEDRTRSHCSKDTRDQTNQAAELSAAMQLQRKSLPGAIGRCQWARELGRGFEQIRR